MTAARTRSRRGVALVFVLATIVLVVPPCVALARAVTTARIERQLRDASALAADVERGAETICARWLRDESEKVVLPPDALVPAVAVVEERFSVSVEREVSVRIVAWDQCGLVPAQFATGASPMKLVLPSEIARAGEPMARVQAPFGLDQLTAAADDASAFPEVDLTRGGEAGRLQALPRPSTLKSPGAWIGMRPLTTGASTAVINVHTARKDVLDAALRDAGRGGLDAILAARAEGRHAALAGASGGDESGGATIALVGESDTWAFRIDVQVGAVRESWWVVFTRDKGGFSRAQRLFIPD